MSPRVHPKPCSSAASTCPAPPRRVGRESSPRATGLSRSRPAPPPTRARPAAADERGLQLAGLLVFLDPPKPDAAAALQRLAGLGIAVKIVTGDNPAVATKVCRDLGLGRGGAMTGADVDALTTTALATAIARPPCSPGSAPKHKARIVAGPTPQRRRRRLPRRRRQRRARPARRRRRHLRRLGNRRRQGRRRRASCWRRTSTSSPTASAKGRRIFANTIKYVLMGTSSNFGNMFSAAGRVDLPVVPADAAVADPAQQPALRHQPAGHPHRQRRRGTAAPPIALGHRLHPPVHDLLRPDQLGLRLRHLRRDALGLPRRRHRNSAPAGSSSPWRPRPWSSSRSAPAASRSSAATPACR